MTDKASKSPKRPKDANQLAKSIVDIATRRADDDSERHTERDKDPAAVALGRRGGLKGGKARALKLDPDARAAIAKKAASVRWGKKHEDAEGE